jgi:hypothetical protein
VQFLQSITRHQSFPRISIRSAHRNCETPAVEPQRTQRTQRKTRPTCHSHEPDYFDGRIGTLPAK